MKMYAEGVIVALALVGATWAENRPKEDAMPTKVRQRVEEVCTAGVNEAIEESTNTFTRKFVTEATVRRGVARCVASELWWMRKFYDATGDWDRALKGYE